MSKTHRILFLVAVTTALVTGGVCRAASVTEIQDEGRRLQVDVAGQKWKPGQVVCVMRDAKKVACGLLAVINSGKGTVSLDFRNQMPVVGDLVLSASDAKVIETARNRAPAAASSTSLVPGPNIRFRSGGRDDWFLSARSIWDLDQISVGGSLERFVSPRVTYGIEAMVYDVANQQTEISGYSVLLRRTFRANRQFTGISASIGAGAYFFKLGAAGAAKTSFGIEGTAGWSMRLTSWLTGSGNVGVVYISQPKKDGIDIGVFHTLRPIFGISLGSSF
jgi:hypothetical protein